MLLDLLSIYCLIDSFHGVDEVYNSIQKLIEERGRGLFVYFLRLVSMNLVPNMPSMCMCAHTSVIIT
ncbi:hypothetical protein GLYMA_04G022000v4 [Glycine max]|uniref:Uncharacterized protein n=1 Tax=Glycine max TaxID=3847 RepID=I1JT05_SOYBN|nr:hypothetical protein GYH30_008687 [Glycine max]KRH61010.1 hypothetical protein GLYMA_04G022000v4 [Glycine max]